MLSSSPDNSSQNPDSSNNNNSSGGNNSNNNTGGGTSGTHSNSSGDSVLSNGNHGTSYHSNRHKRRGGETRLRESQSLNRITEVVETETSAHSGCEPGIAEVETSGGKENVCFKCCMEEMCSIEKSLVCEKMCAGRVEQNNNTVKNNSERLADVDEVSIEQTISPSTSVHSSISQTKNLTNVYSRQNKYRYIHNSNTNSGGGKMISSISCNDIPDGSNAKPVSCSENNSSDQSSAIEKSSRKFNTITRLRNRHNKENSSSSEAKSKQESPLPSNGSAGTNQNARTSATVANGQTLPVVNKNKKSNKNTLINRYLYLQKKLVMPLFGGRKTPSIKSEGRLYKAKSCSEVEKTSCTGNSKMNVLSKNRAVTMTRCSKHVTECTTGQLKLTASIVNIDHRTSTVI